MGKYLPKVQELAQSPVCGERFQNLIRRHEMNCEPPPAEGEPSAQPYGTVFQYHLPTANLLFLFCSTAPATRKWGQGRLLEAEEEDYFNNSDDEDAPKPGPSSLPMSPLGSGSVNTMKRKRGKGFTTTTTAAVPRTQKQLRPLVDYDDDDDETGNIASSSKSDKTPTVPSTDSSPPKRLMNWFAGLPSEGPRSPSLTVAKGQTNPFEEDKTMEIKSPALTDSPPRLGEKRRRDEEDDEDELLERLVRSKRPSVGSSADKEEKTSPKTAAPGKMKLKLGPAILNLTSSPSSSEKKDGGSDG